MARLNKL